MVCGQESLAAIVEVLVHILVIHFTTECSAHFHTWLFITKAWNEVIRVVVHISLEVFDFKFKL